VEVRTHKWGLDLHQVRPGAVLSQRLGRDLHRDSTWIAFAGGAFQLVSRFLQAFSHPNGSGILARRFSYPSEHCGVGRQDFYVPDGFIVWLPAESVDQCMGAISGSDPAVARS